LFILKSKFFTDLIELANLLFGELLKNFLFRFFFKFRGDLGNLAKEVFLLSSKKLIFKPPLIVLD